MIKSVISFELLDTEIPLYVKLASCAPFPTVVRLKSLAAVPPPVDDTVMALLAPVAVDLITNL